MRPKNALDVGCGQGFGTFCLSHHFNTVGVDTNSQNIKIARIRFPKLVFKVMDATQFKFQSDFFDFVLMDNVLEHLKSPNLALEEIKRVLKTHGKTKIVVPDQRSELFLGCYHPDYSKNIGHQKIFSSGEIEDAMDKIGMKLTDKKSSYFLTNLEVLIMLKINKKKNNQLDIGDWRKNFWTKLIHVSFWYFKPSILYTPLKYLPIWIITLPIGFLISIPGNKFLPKSVELTFEKVQS